MRRFCGAVAVPSVLVVVVAVALGQMAAAASVVRIVIGVVKLRQVFFQISYIFRYILDY